MRRRDMKLLLGGALLAVAPPAKAQNFGPAPFAPPPKPPASDKDRLAASRRAAIQFAATLTAHDITAFAALLADDYINHQISAAAPKLPPKMTFKQASVGYFQARLWGMPNLHVGIETMLADPDTVAASFVYSGEHTGNYMGVAPTGKRLQFTSCDIFRVKDGLIVEHWGMGDTAGILAQLKG